MQMTLRPDRAEIIIDTVNDARQFLRASLDIGALYLREKAGRSE